MTVGTGFIVDAGVVTVAVVVIGSDSGSGGGDSGDDSIGAVGGRRGAGGREWPYLSS